MKPTELLVGADRVNPDLVATVVSEERPVRSGKPLREVRPGNPEIPLDGGRGDAEGPGGLFDVESTEDAALHHLTGPGVQALELFEGPIELEDRERIHRHCPVQSLLQGHRTGPSAPLLGLTVPGLVEDDLTHGPGSKVLEVGTALDGDAFGGGQLEPGFVNERRRAQGLACAPPDPVGQVLQLRVGDAEDLISRVPIPGLSGLDEFGEWLALVDHFRVPEKEGSRALSRVPPCRA